MTDEKYQEFIEYVHQHGLNSEKVNKYDKEDTHNCNMEYISYIDNHKKKYIEAYDKYHSLLESMLHLDKSLVVKEHDESKYKPEEFHPYRVNWYPTCMDRFKKENDMYLPDEDPEEKYQLAWLYHVHNNRHHPEYWTLVNGREEVSIKIYDMSDTAIAEFLLDLIAMGDAKKYFCGVKIKEQLFGDKTESKIISILDQL